MLDYTLDPVVRSIKARPMPADYRGHVAETMTCGCGFTTDQTTAAVIHGYMDHGWRVPAAGRWSSPRGPRSKAA